MDEEIGVRKRTVQKALLTIAALDQREGGRERSAEPTIESFLATVYAEDRGDGRKIGVLSADSR